MDKDNQTFRSVWRNKYLRNIIFYYLNLYNNNIKNFNLTIQELESYLYKYYLADVTLKGGNSTLEAGVLPSSIRDLKFIEDYNPILKENSLPDSLIKLTFNSKFNQQLNDKIIRNGIKSIEFTGIFNQSLGGWLPKGLEILKLGPSFQQPILPNQIPDGLKFLYLNDNYQSTIIYGSIPSSVENLRYIVKDTINSDTKIPVSTTSLTISANIDIQVGMIPHNITNIKFDDSFNGTISEFSLPSSIRSISFGDNFNRHLRGNTLLSNIESIKLGKFFRSHIDIPSTVKSFKLTSNGNHYGYFHYNSDFNECYSLSNLEFGRSDNPNLQNNILPNSNSLKTLDLGGYQGNQLFNIPQSITNLNLGFYFNFPIEENTLPENLKSLNFGKSFDRPININALPRNLKIIFFECPTFNQDILDLPNQLPFLESIYISSNNINFINTLDPYFYSKYIKISDE
ncbi:hypothetical protein ACTA71_004625 [Dictyostelium dimigraforme]